ncbi:MAG: PD40 domain-containing protein [Spirochaetes bacterium]|nr:PD40 domain-containing protein [Spirochaetota bacterium]
MVEEKMRVIRAAILLAFACAAALNGCGGRASREVKFSYGTILRNEYIYNVGGAVPVTIEQSTEFDGSFTENGLFLFYSSDRESGNFDIYIRSLTDITTVRVTSHPSKDTSPAVSPDGKRLAFVSQREDPEGDIYVVELEPAELIEAADASPSGIPTLDDRAKNVSLYQDPVSKDIKIIRDASPAWSPDGKWIAFSSSRGGNDDIWMTDPEGKNLKQVTRKGGTQPRFSADGKKIIFVSYRDAGSNGDIYSVDLASGAESRITNTPHIELYPTFMGKGDEIAYTLIDRDTSRDGKVTLKDTSVLMYRDLKTGLEYALTPRSQSSFAPRWSGALKKINERFHDVIVYSDQIGENININVIPDQGIIPLKNTAEYQHGLAQMYLSEHDDRERYLMGLERVYHFYGDKNDSRSILYVAKSLTEAGREHHSSGNSADAARILGVLSGLSRDAKDYRSILAEYLRNLYAGKAGDAVLRRALEEMGGDAGRQDYVPFLMEDLGDEEARLGRAQDAVGVYGDIARKYPKYKRIDHVDFKTASLLYRSAGPALPDSYVRVLNSSNVYLKIDAAKNIIKIFGDERDFARKIGSAGKILGAAEKRSDREVTPLMQYVLGEAHFGAGNFKSAGEYLEKTLAGVSKTNYLFYKANMLMGSIAERQGDLARMEKYYYENVKNYLLRWKQNDFRQILGKLVHYYEERGAVLTRERKHAQATGFYEKYIDVITRAHLLRQFEDIYNGYGSRSHVLYIDSYSAGGGEKKKLLALEKKYAERSKLDIARLNYDKAYLYGLAYIYAKLGVASDPKNDGSGGSLKELLQYFRNSVDQIAWALFMDDTYVEPYLLQGWISQYVDLRRREYEGRNENTFSEFFPRLLWEANVPLYEKALAANDGVKNPETEGGIHLNLGNTYFLLNNYPAALREYQKALQLKRTFSSPVKEALFRFHLGYCYWQYDRLDMARDEMRRALMIYNGLSQSGGAARYRDQIYLIYRYFALFSRMEGDWSDAITWYNRVLEFAERNRIEVDRARYLQEIAGCYRGMGDTVRALSYLDQADRILAGQTEEERKYRLRFKAFGLGPVSFWDLGPDTAVIGDNRLYTELDTTSKKVLSLSMREDIHYEQGDYAKAIHYLRKKLEIWEKRDHRINQTARVRTMNNIGYCFYRMGRHDEALSHFKKAWDYAAGTDVNDLEGTFITMLNYANLYAMLVERGARTLAGAGQELDSLAAKISRYKDGYEKAKYERDLESLKNDRKARKLDVTPGEMEDLKKSVAESARAVYYQVDTAVGTLMFTRAEHLMRGAVDTGGKGAADAAMDVLHHNRRVYELYGGAMERFRSAMDFSERNQNRRVTARLLLNIASCQKRTGMLDDAYETLFGAEDLAIDFAYDDVKWITWFKTAEFLHEYGASVEGAGYARLADGYYRKAVDLVTECPQCYGGSAHLARGLFDQYARFLVERGDWREALHVLEKKYAVDRVMLVAMANPQFGDAADRDRFAKYEAGVREMTETRGAISSLLVAGEPADSEKVRARGKELAARKSALNGMARAIRGENPLLASFIAVPDVTPRPVAGAAVFAFADIAGKLHAWSVDGGLSFGEVPSASGKDANARIRGYLAGKCKDPGKRCFVVLNDAAANLIVREDLKNYPAFTFVPSIERARHYMDSTPKAISSVYYGGTGLAGRLAKDGAFAGIRISEGAAAGADLSKYSVIVDPGEYDSPLGARILFGRKASPALMVRRVSPLELGQVCLLAESALYAGTKSLVVYDRLGNDELAGVVKAAKRGPLESINRGGGFTGVIPVGGSGPAGK